MKNAIIDISLVAIVMLSINAENMAQMIQNRVNFIQTEEPQYKQQ